MKWRLDGGRIEVLDEALAEVLRRKTLKLRYAAVAVRGGRDPQRDANE